MTAADRAQLEAEIRRRFDDGDLDGAMTAAIRGYGQELHGMLYGLSRDAALASELFAETCERMWRGFPKFRWGSTLRVWAYSIARHTFFQVLRERRRRPTPVALSGVPSDALAAMDRIRSRTRPEHRTELKGELARLRAELEPDDRLLLGLRVERRMPWNDIARIFGAEDDAGIKREAASLRKRYERIKARLRQAATNAS